MPKRTNKDELSSAWISDGANKAWLIRNGEATSVEPEQYPLEKVINPTGAGDSTFGVQIVADFLNISPIKSVITACKVAAGKIATKFAQAIGAKSWAEDIAWQNTSPRMDYFTR
jgi:sugar/nucleoside kinase (ribokinase family)